jgi:uncharacterized protein YodC (DUF2158 family)
MTVFKPGNLVVLKSGGPVMTVDAVNTSIFDDNKVTGIVCVWFVGEKLQRVRFEQGAIEPARLRKPSSRKRKARLEEATGEYKVVLDEMVAAMNAPADTGRDASREVAERSKPARMTNGLSSSADEKRGSRHFKARPAPFQARSAV